MAQDMLLTEEKIRHRLWELYPFRHREKRMISQFRVEEDTTGEVNPKIPDCLSKEGEMIAIGDTWTGRDKYLWIQTKLVLPKEWAEDNQGEAIGFFDFGLTGHGYNSGFESMLYIDGEPYQSVDTNHQEVFFKPQHIGRELTLTFRLWSGLDGGGEPRELTHMLQVAYVALLDKATDDIYYTGDTVLQTVNVLREEQLERHELLHALDKAFLCIDWNEKGSSEFYQSIQFANDKLQTAIDDMDKHTKATVSCVGHTHIDTAWRWRLKHTAEKASRSFSTVLRYMEKYPEYIFLHTQPQQYAYIKEYFPDIFAQIKERVKAGQWEIDGGMWVEPDCNLPSGESLTRQLLMGRKFMLEEFDHEPEYLWLPDVFGYSYALPQILEKSGIHTFMTTKIAWNQYNRMPNDTFWWKGLDGSKVLAHFITTPMPGQDTDTNFYSDYNGHLLPDTVSGSWKLYREKHLNPETLICYGYGDGGGGVTREMLERRRRIDRIPGLPKLQPTKAGAYFERLWESVKNTDEPMATWDGEMYLEYHRGTYTSQAYVKKMNRRMEELYRKAEWLASMNAIASDDMEKTCQQQLQEGWKMLLTHQFHDIIPGSSMREVYDDAKVYYQKMSSIAEKIVADSIADMSTDDSKQVVSVLNVLPQERTGLVNLGMKQWKDGMSVRTEDGENVIVQNSEDGVFAYVRNVPAMGATYLYLDNENEDGIEADSIFEVEDNQESMKIVSPYYIVELNKAGQISSLYDKEKDMQVLSQGECANVLQIFEDKPLDYDAWDIDMYYYQKMQVVTELVSRKLVENGPLRLVIRQEWNVGKSHICQDMILYRHTGRIDFKTHIDWQETQKLLKTAFPVDIRTTYATYDIQYGNIRRANNSNSSWERAKFEVVGHRFADLSEYGYGVSLLNDCKYGYDVHQNVMRLTLLKAAIFPDPTADKGEHDFTYALYPHIGDFVEGKTVQEAADLNQPLEAVEGKLTLPAKEGSTLELTGAYVELDAVKPSENGEYVVIRFHEYAGAKETVRIRFGFPVREICECDLMERPIQDMQKLESDTYEVFIRPYEIKTFLVKMEV